MSDTHESLTRAVQHNLERDGGTKVSREVAAATVSHILRWVADGLNQGWSLGFVRLDEKNGVILTKYDLGQVEPAANRKTRKKSK